VVVGRGHSRSFLIVLVHFKVEGVVDSQGGYSGGAHRTSTSTSISISNSNSTTSKGRGTSTGTSGKTTMSVLQLGERTTTYGV